ncbi:MULTISPECIES: TetR/AcrR family transcriptional regulator [unclassified Agarivorans]|uniref:TetR/AcrR family transcriptional regulator n=1 Tax=unclassified Agarivorans TaxID=2636026 RepID=UPI003D7EA808
MDKKLTSRQQKSLITKKKLYNSALALMNDSNIEDITISHICSSAGVSVGSFYKHFATKTDIFVEMYDQADDFFEEKYTVQKTTSTTKEAILEYFETYAQYHLKVGLQTVKQLYTCNNKLFIMKGRNMQKFLTLIIQQGQKNHQIDETTSAERLTEYLFISARGLIYNWCLHDGHLDLSAEMNIYMQRLLKSIAA